MTPDELQQITAIVATAKDQTVEAMRGLLQAAEERAQEFSRQIETNLLTAFHGHAKGQTARLHTIEVTLSDTATRIAALEERVLNIETRRRPEPPTQ